MNIAFPALIIYLFVLPGILLRYCYRRGFFETSPIVISKISEEIAFGVLFAAGLHFIWGWLSSLFGYDISIKTVLQFLTNHYFDDSLSYNITLLAVSQYPTQIFLYFLTINIMAILIGFGSHWLIRLFYLDIRFQFFRFSNKWYYLFSGGQDLIDNISDLSAIQKLKLKNRTIRDYLNTIGLIWVSTIIDHGGKAYIYRAILSNYYFNKSGELDKIVLTQVFRRSIDKDRTPDQEHAPLPDERYYPVEGNYMVVQYSEINTINIEYLPLQEIAE